MVKLTHTSLRCQTSQPGAVEVPINQCAVVMGKMRGSQRHNRPEIENEGGFGGSLMVTVGVALGNEVGVLFHLACIS